MHHPITRPALVKPSAPPAPAVNASATAVPRNPFITIGYATLLLTTYVLCGRLTDVVLVNMKIPFVLLGILVICLLASGSLLRILKVPSGKYISLLVVWMAVCGVLSHWRGGSIVVFYDLVRHAIVFMLFFVVFVRSLRHLRTTFFVAALSMFTAACFIFVFRGEVAGRYALQSGSYTDPNEYALALLSMLPFCFSYFKSEKSTGFFKLLGIAMAPAYLFAFFATGSRGGLIGLALVGLLLLLRAPGFMRVLVPVAGVVIAITVLSLVPAQIRERYTTFFTSNSDQTGAVGSAMARRELLERSIEMTLAHPLFGVGPGMFSVVLFEENVRDTGYHGNVQVTHNTFTQASSELGLPGLALLLFAVGSMWKSLYRFQKFRNMGDAELRMGAHLAFLLWLSLSGALVCSIFLSMLYIPIVYVVFGFCISHELLMRERLFAVGIREHNVRPANLVGIPAARRLPVP